jgi:hypothetical protein
MNAKKSLPIAVACLLACVSQSTFADDGTKHKDQETAPKHQVRIKVDHDGKPHVFKFDRAELADAKLMEKRLAGLDDETKAEVMKGLNMIKSRHNKAESMDVDEHAMTLHHDKKHMHKQAHEHKKSHGYKKAHEHKQAHEHKKSHEHKKAHEHKQAHEHKKSHEHGHQGKQGKTDMIVRLLEHGKFSAEQIMSIQKALDAKK